MAKKRRLGDRYDGRKVRSLSPMNYVSPFVMKTRQDASNYFKSSLDLSKIDEYIAEKRAEGKKSFGFMHVVIAAYTRVVSQRPAINRFIAGQRIFQRGDIVISMMVKKEMTLNAQSTAIKLILDPADTPDVIYDKMELLIEEARKAGDSTAMDSVARALVGLPALLLRGFVGLMRGLDYFGLMPKIINKASPFHASLFLSNLGSLGIPPIYHHLYDFGNAPLFLTFGAKYRKPVMAEDGSVSTKKFIDYTVVSDERITDGHYMASAFKYLEYMLKHPKLLDTPPESVIEDVD